MRDRLVRLADLADQALASCHDLIDSDQLVPVVASVQAVRTRLAYPEDVMVLALAGGTGSGKSSLFNALAGQELAAVGGVRPTTGAPAVAVPRSVGQSMDGFLDRLGIDERHVHDGPAVCLIDLPDTDSVEMDHRHRVDNMIPLVDAVAWVVDPEKYRDARLHHDYLRPMAPYSPQFLLVINQVDRLSPEDAEAVEEDVAKALVEDGIPDCPVLLVAAAPPAGPPLGVDEIWGTLVRMRDNRDLLYRKLLTDLAGASESLAASVGQSLDFDRRAVDVEGRAVEALAARESTAATSILVGFVDELGRETGGASETGLRRLSVDVPDHVSRIADAIQPEVRRRRRWFVKSPQPATPDLDQARRMVDEAVIRPARVLLAKRGLAIASVAELAVSARALTESLTR